VLLSLPVRGRPQAVPHAPWFQGNDWRRRQALLFGNGTAQS
jgi:hypothetical protein